MKQTAKKFLLPFIRPFWRRIWFRVVEGRIAPIEGRISSLRPGQHRSKPEWHRSSRLWHTHIPSFLNAVASVPAVSHEIVGLSKRLDELAEIQSQPAEAAEG